MQPYVSVAKHRPLYLAVLEEAEARRRVLVAPFGRFSEPALPGELATDLAPVCLKVLCVWNARWLAAELIDQSWWVAELPLQLLEESALLMEHLQGRREFIGRLTERVGPPMQHPCDPRWEYWEEEKSVMDEIADGKEGNETCSRGKEKPIDPCSTGNSRSRDRSKQEKDVGLRNSVKEEHWPTKTPSAAHMNFPCVGEDHSVEEVDYAAEQTSGYGHTARFRVLECPFFVDIQAGGAGIECVAQVLDESGQPSMQLDGYRFQAQSGKISRPIVRGIGKIPREFFRHRFCLVTPDGTPMTLVPVRRV